MIDNKSKDINNIKVKFTNKKIKLFLLSLMSTTVVFTSSCGMSKEEMIARALQGVITGTVAYLKPITPAQENQIGQEMTKQVFSQYKEYTLNQDLTNYVRSIGDKVIQQATRKNELSYKIYLLDSTEINAFTIPGGSIFVTTELLKYLNNEAELVAVLGHELGHNENKHPTETIKRAMAAQGLAQGALSGNDTAILRLLAQISLDLILKGFNRAQEKESDETGALILSKLNYNTESLSGFLKTLLSLSNDPNALIKLFSTHPGSQERIENLDKFLSSKNIKNNSTTTNEDIYKKYISVLPAKVAIK